MASDEGGVWRTIGGRRVFIKDGEDLESAMKNSGKFKSKKDDTSKKDEDVKEQGNSNRKEVKEKIQNHILEYYEDDDNPEEAFVKQMEAMKDNSHPTPYSWGRELAEGGNYLIYNEDMNEFLDKLKINPKGKKFKEDQSFKMYVNLVARESANLYEKLKKK